MTAEAVDTAHTPGPMSVGHDTGPVLGLSGLPLTIVDWRDAQKTGGGYERICALVESEHQQNPRTHAWISLASQEQVRQQWDQLESRPGELPLFGVPFAAKDNIDVQGFVTTGGCRTFAREPAASDATVIANLKAAGAILIGKTNLDQFATGLVGTRSPYGAVPNSCDSTRVSGGSSSGSAVVVGRGVVPFSLGTDTAGSGRVPAGLNNIVGLKPTRGRLSTRGVLPACRTLDCVSIFALTAGDADIVLSAAEGFDVDDAYSRARPAASFAPKGVFGAWSLPREPLLAICADPPWFGRNDHSAAYEAALAKAEKLGWKLTPVDFRDLFALAKLLYDGPWVAERYAAIQEFIERDPEAMDPTVLRILSRAKNFSAADAFASEYIRQELTRKIEIAFKSFDAILVPTSPTFPTIEQVAQDPVGENSLLGTYTNFVNFLDWSALSVPAGFRTDGLPFGMTLIANAWQESQLLQLAHRWTAGTSSHLGATKTAYQHPTSIKRTLDATMTDHVRVAVVGAHLTGFPLNNDLVSRKAVFEEATRTSGSYKLYSLKAQSGPKKPGLERVKNTEGGREIEVEVWRLPTVTLASFMSTIPSPLGIGSIELQNGDWVHGFVCEPIGLSDADDITEFGGWRAYTKHLALKSISSAPSHPGRIKRVLIANRGEIAVRMIRSLHKLDMQAVVVYSDADADAQHVRNADVAHRLEGSTVAETYLDGSQILRLAISSSVDAILPGYGFLAENSEFAAAVEAAGMVWIGPTPKQMSDLGLKHLARAIASKAGVQAVPGSDALLISLEDACTEANKIGFPLMLKSTAGGGGIGLKHCVDMKALEDAFHSVQNLAKANFGDGGVFLERFVQNARHIEVQILGDGKGRVISAGERDCSLQRRHQKVVEESPAFAVPLKIREEMKDAAVRLASAVDYRNVGTVEFIYDVDTQEFYFLEVNTRLQVEHPVTEAVTGLDLVECMVRIAGDDCSSLFGRSTAVAVSGASIEVRLYAESPLQGFQPRAGTIRQLDFPLNLRVDTWIEVGTRVSTSYDPLLAKLIATGADRREALAQMSKGLAETEIKGVVTNLEYLRQIIDWQLFQSGGYTTRSLDGFEFRSPSFEILEPGSLTTVQDYPGRVGYWNVGIPPSGPADSLSFRLANRLIGNPVDAAGIECTLQGPTLRFHEDAVVAVTGAKAAVNLDGECLPLYQALHVRRGQILSIGAAESGYRMYVGIRGGVGVDSVMGSRATFELGKIGGHNGRKLQRGDILPFAPGKPTDGFLDVLSISPSPIPTKPKALWTVGVIPGPHGVPDFFTADGLASLFSSEWRVHHNSNRLGVRLTGPKPQWARQTGGEAGLHPSNIHDSPYSIGSVSFTGDEAVVLACDGPSLGGFVVFCVVASAEMWKLGQVRPGDSICFRVISVDIATRLDAELTQAITDLQPIPLLKDFVSHDFDESRPFTKAENIGNNGQRIMARQAGDRAMLLEFGDSDIFDLRQSFHIRAFCEHHESHNIPGVTELCPGVRTLHVSYAHGLSPTTILHRLSEHARAYAVPSRVSSRALRLPLAFDDTVSRAAIQRYTATIRPEAPWLPSNVAFLEQLNGIDDISTILTDSTFLVIGLGDVFLGSPLAIPLDPRRRLFGTKYNPSRNFTPHGAVGIGGQYLCIYAMDSPGGYQLVGRTVDIWDPKAVPFGDGKHTDRHDGDPEPWMFRAFDRITFYPIREDELDAGSPEALVQITDGELDLGEYERLMEQDSKEITAVAAKRAEAISSAPFLDELTRPYRPKNEPTQSDEHLTSGSESGGERVRAMMPGRCYKCVVKPGDRVSKGDVLVWIESSKMEVEIRAPMDGICVRVLVKEGNLVDADDDLVTIEAVDTDHT